MSGNEAGEAVASIEVRRKTITTTGETVEINGRDYVLRSHVNDRATRSLSLYQSRVAAGQRQISDMAKRAEELSDWIAQAQDEITISALCSDQEDLLDQIDAADQRGRRWLAAALDLFLPVDDELRANIAEANSIAQVMQLVNFVAGRIGLSSPEQDAEGEGLDPTEPPSPPSSSLPPPSGPPSESKASS